MDPPARAVLRQRSLGGSVVAAAGPSLRIHSSRYANWTLIGTREGRRVLAGLVDIGAIDRPQSFEALLGRLRHEVVGEVGVRISNDTRS